MKRIVTALLLIVCVLGVAVMGACDNSGGGGGGGSKKIKSISVTTMPKTEYEVGEALDLTGGEITATYSDDSTKKVSMTDSSVTVQKPNMNTAGQKNVSVTYDSKSTTFKITVSEAKLTVTFNMNYDGAQNATAKVANGETATAPADPSRPAFTFMGWYVAADGNTKFNFAAPITKDETVYAHWGYSVRFDYNFDGASHSESVVAPGEKVTAPATNPERGGYVFTGWFKDSDGTTAFDFTQSITANTEVYAGWQQISENATVYTVTFLPHDGTAAKTERKVVEGSTVASFTPTTPEGAEATFVGWYTDEELTAAYDFTAPVASDLTLHAKWNVTKYSVTFHYNHKNNDGVFEIETIRVNQPAYNPTMRNGDTGYYDSITLTGYYFGGWYKDAECTEKVNFDDRINAFTNYYAKWLKEWEFQAEYTDFGEREAFGYSANGTGAAAFINKNNAELWGAHNGFWVANLHKKGLYVEFVIESDAEVFDAALILRLSADFYDIVLSKSNFEIKVNDQVIDYSFVASIEGAVPPDEGGIMNKRPFDNWDFGFDVHLVKGSNTIRFTMLDEVRYGEVGTMYATAPMFDSIYVNTNANLSWSPMTDNV